MSKLDLGTNNSLINDYGVDYDPVVSTAADNGVLNNISHAMDGSNGSFPRLTPFSDWSGLVRIPLYSLIFALALGGNALVITTLVQNKRMRTVTNAFILNLAVSDLLLAVLCMPFTLVPILLRNFTFGEAMCALLRYLQGEFSL